MHPDDEKIEASKEPISHPHHTVAAKPLSWFAPTIKKSASFVVFVSIVLMLAANGTTSWATYTINGVTVDVGLWSTCIDDGQGCQYNDWSGYALCSLTPSDIRDRFHSIIGMGILGSICGIVYLIAAHAPRVKSFFSTFVRFLSLLLFVTSFVTVLALFVYTWNSWYFCGGDVCEYFVSIDAPDCEWHYSHSLVLAAIGMPFAIIGLALNVVSVCKSRFAVDKDGKAAPSGAPERVDTDKTAPQHYVPAEKFEVPEGNWRFDATSGFWWSDDHHLYFNDATGNYYDPDEQSWFDPITNEWS